MKNLTKEQKEQIKVLYDKWQLEYSEQKTGASFDIWLDQLPTEEDEPKEVLTEKEIDGMVENMYPPEDKQYPELLRLVYRNGIMAAIERVAIKPSHPLNQSNPLSKEEIKGVLKKSAFYVEPKDTDIVYINIERTAEQICNLSPASISEYKLNRAETILIDEVKKLLENDNKEVRQQLMVLNEMDHTHEILDGKANRRKRREQKRKNK